MLPKDIIRKIRRIQITTNRLVNESLAGEYHSVFKGRGMEFEDVREYQHGDDIRTIDWNVTSRAGRPFVKRYVEERELTVMLLVDASASGSFGSAGKTKGEVSAEISALLAFSAIKNNDRVGALLFTDHVEKFIPPRRGATHVLRVVREVLFHRPQGRGTRIESALEHLNLVIRKRAVVFLISDLLDQGYEQALKVANRKHDVVIIQIVDPREQELPPLGILEIRDAETGEIVYVDSSLPEVREIYRQNWEQNRQKQRKLFQSHRIDNVTIDTAQPYDVPLVRFFAERARRLT
ncbi:MAG: DUF58 domain-containing protein [Acidobacteria bacterium]|nr:MAG: DUF58 domain-containing protein [Acidobacteriota bacterium]PYV00359.1 MAG: DUF58 domain-containing protein [Acidobacteriota bacterium]PYV35083.1 MAG: DUF58 domain-containing protein [Acidobacteriota bacterium]